MRLGVGCYVHHYVGRHWQVCKVCGVPKRGAMPRYVYNFWRHVDRKGLDECWLWKGRVDKDGYGHADALWPSRMAHRVSWFLVTGRWPVTSDMDHTCHNTACVNPGHLREVTHQENMDNRRCSGKCKKGHDMSGENRMAAGAYHGRVYARCRICYEADRDARRERSRLQRERGQQTA